MVITAGSKLLSIKQKKKIFFTSHTKLNYEKETKNVQSKNKK